MPTTLTTKAIEKNTFVITATFTDEAKQPITPNTGLIWTLTDVDGTVINNRLDIPIASASSVDIVLSGDDLALTPSRKRVLLIKGTYDSTLGANLPIQDQVTFEIDGLVAIT